MAAFISQGPVSPAASLGADMGLRHQVEPHQSHHHEAQQDEQDEQEESDGKAENDADDERQLLFGLEVYIKQIHGLSLAELRKKPPLIAFSFMDFAPQLIQCHQPHPAKPSSHDDDQKEDLGRSWRYTRGKSCLFTSSSHSLLRALRRIPLVLMLVDEVNHHQAQLYANACLSLANFRPKNLWLWGPETVETWGHADEECVAMYSTSHCKGGGRGGGEGHQQVALVDISIAITCYGPAASHPLLLGSGTRERALLRKGKHEEAASTSPFHHQKQNQAGGGGVVVAWGDDEEEEEGAREHEQHQEVQRLLHDVPDPSHLGGWRESLIPGAEGRESLPPPLFYLAPRHRSVSDDEGNNHSHQPHDRLPPEGAHHQHHHHKHEHYLYQLSPGLARSVIKTTSPQKQQQQCRPWSADRKNNKSPHRIWRDPGIAPPYSPGQKERVALLRQHQSHSPARSR